MKNHRKTDQQASAEEHEIEIFRGLTGTIHRFRYGTAKNIRMSLTIRISAHYCAQLTRSFLHLLFPVLMICLLLTLPEIRETRKRILAQPLAVGEVYQQDVVMDSHVQAYVSDEVIPEDFFQRAGFYLSHLFQRGYPWQYCIPGRQKTTDAHVVMIYYRISPVIYRFAMLMLLACVADLIRMAYFLRHHARLDRTVLKPIRDMTEIAATVSANNLSNRIDVSGLKNEFQELAEVINSMLDRLEVSYESQKQFVSDASHELRTPIAVIQGYADMLKRWGKDDPQVLEEGIEAISHEAVNMKDLVQDLLFLARHDKKTLMMEYSAFDPVELLGEVRKEAEMVCPEDHFVVEHAEHMTLHADRNMIKQVLRILLDNAAKYMAKGGTITLGVRRDQDFAVFRVEDEGCGISPDDLPHIFDRFFRADKSRQSDSGGHGLGLSIARIIVVAHGGRIRVRSKLQEGTVFYVEIPLSGGVSGETEVKEEQQEKAASRIRKARRRHKKRQEP